MVKQYTEMEVDVMVRDPSKFPKFQSRGKEGYIIPDGNGMCLKIFFEEFRNQAKRNKILSQVGIKVGQAEPHIIWPVDIVEGPNGQFLGYQMPYVQDGEPLAALFQKDMLGFDQSSMIRIAINIARLFKRLHSFHIAVGDCNPMNFLIKKDCQVFMIDTDSMQFSSKGEQYPTQVAMGRYIDPDLLGRLSKDYNNDVSKLPFGSFNIYTDRFALAILIFQLLMLGFHPFMGAKKCESSSSTSVMPIEMAIHRKRCLYFSDDTDLLPKDAPGVEMLGDELSNLFRRAFFGRMMNRPSEDEFINALESYEKSLVSCTLDRRHRYRAGLTECPFCRVERTKSLIKEKEIADSISLAMQNAQNTPPTTAKQRAQTHSGGNACSGSPSANNYRSPGNHNTAKYAAVKQNVYSGAPSIVMSLSIIFLHLILLISGVTGSAFSHETGMGAMLFPLGSVATFILGAIMAFAIGMSFYQTGYSRWSMVPLGFLLGIVGYILIILFVPTALAIIGYVIGIGFILLIIGIILGAAGG